MRGRARSKGLVQQTRSIDSTRPLIRLDASTVQSDHLLATLSRARRVRRWERVSGRGFTLVEALAAGMILAVVAAVIGSAVTHSMASLTESKDQQLAAGLLDQIMTKIDLIGPERVSVEGPFSGSFDGDNSRFTWEATVESMYEGHLYDVTVTVSWPTMGGTRSVEAHTYLNDEPESRNAELMWDSL